MTQPHRPRTRQIPYIDRDAAVRAVEDAARRGNWSRLRAIRGPEGEVWHNLVPFAQVWQMTLGGWHDTLSVVSNLPPIAAMLSADARTKAVVDLSGLGKTTLLRWLATNPGMEEMFRLDSPTAASAVERAISSRQDAAVVTWLERGFGQERFPYGWNKELLLTAVAREGLPASLDYLLRRRGYSPNPVDSPLDHTTLSAAIIGWADAGLADEAERWAIVQALLDAGADLDAPGVNGTTARALGKEAVHRWGNQGEARWRQAVTVPEFERAIPKPAAKAARVRM